MRDRITVIATVFLGLVIVGFVLFDQFLFDSGLMSGLKFIKVSKNQKEDPNQPIQIIETSTNLVEPPSIRVVIARYNEQLDNLLWLREYDHLIYNRGPDDLNTTFKQFNMSENVGREAYIYFHYIVHNYDDLSDVTVFSQAKQLEYREYNYSEAEFHRSVSNIANGIYQFRKENDGFVYLLEVCLDFMYGFENTHGYERYYPLLDYYVASPRFAPTGCFAVTKEAIRRNPVTYYEKLLETVSHDNTPDVGYFYERTWSQIFHSSCNEGEKYYCSFITIENCLPARAKIGPSQLVPQPVNNGASLR